LEFAVLSLVGCPDCQAPAEVTDRFTLTSTDGPVDHVVVICAAGHRFRMPAEGLAVADDAVQSVLRLLSLVHAADVLAVSVFGRAPGPGR
jgi:hypothetical protein